MGPAGLCRGGGMGGRLGGQGGGRHKAERGLGLYAKLNMSIDRICNLS